MTYSEYHKNYYEKHRDELNAKRREWCREHHDEVLEKRKKYRIANREQINAKNREWRKNHPETMRESRRKYNATHREENRERQRKYHIAHKDEYYEKRDFLEINFKHTFKHAEPHRNYNEWIRNNYDMVYGYGRTESYEVPAYEPNWIRESYYEYIEDINYYL